MGTSCVRGTDASAPRANIASKAQATSTRSSSSSSAPKSPRTSKESDGRNSRSEGGRTSQSRPAPPKAVRQKNDAATDRSVKSSGALHTRKPVGGPSGSAEAMGGRSHPDDGHTVVKAEVRPARSFSHRSSEALSALDLTARRLRELEDRVAALDQHVRGQDLSSRCLGKAKTDLTQLEAEAHKLESSGIDNIYTGHLKSGRTVAKETKKDQLRRLEALFDKIETIFQIASQGAASEAGSAAVVPFDPSMIPSKREIDGHF